MKPFSSPEPKFLLVTWSAKRNFVPGSLPFASLDEREPGSEIVPSERRKRTTGLTARQSAKVLLRRLF